MICRGPLVAALASLLCALVFLNCRVTVTPTVFDSQGNEEPNAARVGIIGAAGYVGSALHKYLRSHRVWNVAGYDRHPLACTTGHTAIVAAPAATQ